MGGEGVPSDGGWPLSLSDKLHSTQSNLQIDTYEECKQQELKHRFEQFVKRQRQKVITPSSSSSSSHHHGHGHHGHDNHHGKKGSHNHNHHHHHQNNNTITEMDRIRKDILQSMSVYIEEGYTFETRQFDYKKRTNLDFKYQLSNQHHHNQQGKNKDQDDNENTIAINKQEEGERLKLMEWNTIQNAGRNILFTSLREDERRFVLNRDHEKHIMNNTNHTNNVNATNDNSKNHNHHHNHHHNTRRNRSKSICNDDDEYDQTTIRHVRNELETIRIQRSETDAAGCSCRKIHVVVYDPNNSNNNHSSKKHHHKRWTERKVKEELRKRHVTIPSNAKREELEQLLYDIVEEQGCCYGNDCICYRNGINCQLDTCTCWHSSHSNTHSGSSSSTSRSKSSSGSKNDTIIPKVEEVLARCGNKYGCYVTDFNEIEKSRKKFITAQKTQICAEC